MVFIENNNSNYKKWFQMSVMVNMFFVYCKLTNKIAVI